MTIIYTALGKTIIHSAWTEERVELLKKLTAEGLTGSQIARELGVSRNAIIGKQHRINCRSKNWIPPTNPQTERVRQTKSRIRDFIKSGELDDLPPEDVPNPKNIIEIAADECHWPVDGEGRLFCAAPVFGRYSYCPHHCSRAFSYRPRLTRAEHELYMRKLAKDHKAQAA